MKTRLFTAVIICLGMVMLSSFIFSAHAQSGLRQQLNEIQQRSKAQYRIRLFGRDTSASCNALKEELDKCGIFYDYREISADKEARTEMWNLIHKNDPSAKAVDLPVVRLNKTLMINPSADEISSALDSSDSASGKSDSVQMQACPSAEPCQVILYGRDSCARCASMKARLDESGIPYTYRNLNDSSCVSEMWKTVRTEKPGTKKVQLPVMAVNGTLLLNPKFAEVKKAMNSSGEN